MKNCCHEEYLNIWEKSNAKISTTGFQIINKYYHTFSFTTNAISIIEGKMHTKNNDTLIFAHD